MSEMPNERLQALLSAGSCSASSLTPPTSSQVTKSYADGCHEVGSVTFKEPGDTPHQSILPNFGGTTEIMKEIIARGLGL
jgi:hypothetical protein